MAIKFTTLITACFLNQSLTITFTWIAQPRSSQHTPNECYMFGMLVT